jgi:transcriptional regulator with XRE-family HTH domain
MPFDREKVRELRERAGLSQAEAAKLAGLANQAAWQQIESGARPNPTVDTLDKIARALGCKAKDLLK